MTNNLKTRQHYLNKLIKYKDSEYVKIITGIKGVGKSSLLLLFKNYLLENNVSENNIIHIDFKSEMYADINSKDLLLTKFLSILEKNSDKKYLLLDEIEDIPSWDKVINGILLDFNLDIYITSNMYKLDVHSKLYLIQHRIHMSPLSFREFINFNDMEITKVNVDTVIGPSYSIKNSANEYQDLLSLYNTYLTIGGLPAISDEFNNIEIVNKYIDKTINTIINDDIIGSIDLEERDKYRDNNIFYEILKYLAARVGKRIHFSKLAKLLNSLRKDSEEEYDYVKVQSLIDILRQKNIIYGIRKFDIKEKDYIFGYNRFCFTDIGILNSFLENKNEHLDLILKNIVFLALKRKGYEVAFGKFKKLDVNFVVIKNFEELLYVQITKNFIDSKSLNKDVKILKKIDDNYEKIILSNATPYRDNISGIKLRNVLDWLLEIEN